MSGNAVAEYDGEPGVWRRAGPFGASEEGRSVASTKCPRCGTIFYSAFASPEVSRCSECTGPIGSGDTWPVRTALRPWANGDHSGNGAHEPGLLVVTRDWDLPHLDQLRHALHCAIEEDDRRDLIVDLSEVDSLGEGLIGVLIGVLKHLQAVGQRLFVVGSRDAALGKLETMGLVGVLGTQPTRAAAVAAAGS
jgi:anti-anti-sigma regulatory factor